MQFRHVVAMLRVQHFLLLGQLHVLFRFRPVFEPEKSRGTGGRAHTIVGLAGVGAQATGSVLAGHDAMDVARFELHSVLVPFETGLRYADDFALQIDCPFIGQDGPERLQEVRLAEEFGDGQFDGTAGDCVAEIVDDDALPVALVAKFQRINVQVAQTGILFPAAEFVLGLVRIDRLVVVEPSDQESVRRAGHLDSQPHGVAHSGLGRAQSLREDGRPVGVHQLATLFLVQLILDVVDGQLRGADGRAHAVAGDAGITAQRIGPAQLVDVARLQFLAVFEPLELRGRESDHFALETDQSFFSQDGLEALEEPRRPVILGDHQSQDGRSAGLGFDALIFDGHFPLAVVVNVRRCYVQRVAAVSVFAYHIFRAGLFGHVFIEPFDLTGQRRDHYADRKTDVFAHSHFLTERLFDDDGRAD